MTASRVATAQSHGEARWSSGSVGVLRRTSAASATIPGIKQNAGEVVLASIAKDVAATRCAASFDRPQRCDSIIINTNQATARVWLASARYWVDSPMNRGA